MSFRPPSSLNSGSGGVLDPLALEILSEKADALGRAGAKVESTLSALAAAETAGRDEEVLRGLIDAAADAVWGFFIQREICGFRSQADVIRRYSIPQRVLARVGVARR